MGEIDILARRLLPSFDRGLKLTSVKTYKCSLKRKKDKQTTTSQQITVKSLTRKCIDHLSRESDGRYVYVRERYLNILFLCCGYDISRPAYQNYFFPATRRDGLRSSAIFGNPKPRGSHRNWKSI